jgi:hypothetical protein
MRDQPRARGIRPFLSAAAALVACSALVSPVAAEAPDVQRAEALKAGYLFNFLKFVEWLPLAPDDTLTVCFLGDSDVHDEFSALAGKRLGAHHLIAQRRAPEETLAACQVLYIDAEQLPAVEHLIVTPPPALLTVSDAPDFLGCGGIIELFADGGRLRFRISVHNARRANLRISSRLLQLASAVEHKG